MPQFSSDERQLLHDSVQDFANQYSFEQFRELSAASHESGFSQDAWRQYGSSDGLEWPHQRRQEAQAQALPNLRSSWLALAAHSRWSHCCPAQCWRVVLWSSSHHRTKRIT